jgi:hypothetical protein
MNAATGAALNGPNALQLEVGGVLGGLYASGAVDQNAGLVFQNGLDWPYGSAPLGGDLYALTTTGKLLWDFKTPAPNGSGVAIANGVVYFQSLDGTLYMLNEFATSASNALLGTVNTGGQYSAPSVADGQIFLGTGDALGFNPPGSIISLGLPSHGHHAATAATAGPTAPVAPTSIGVAPLDSASITRVAGPASPAAEVTAIDDAVAILAAAARPPAINQDRIGGSPKNSWGSLFDGTTRLMN